MGSDADVLLTRSFRVCSATSCLMHQPHTLSKLPTCPLCFTTVYSVVNGCTYVSDGHVEAPALRDGDLVGRARRADVGPGRRGGRQAEGEGGRRRRSVLYPAPPGLLPEANAAKVGYSSDLIL